MTCLLFRYRFRQYQARSHTSYSIQFHSVWKHVMTRTHVKQFTLVHVVECHSIISWIMSSYFPMTSFKATVCASTGDNRHKCAPTSSKIWVVNGQNDPKVNIAKNTRLLGTFLHQTKAVSMDKIETKKNFIFYHYRGWRHWHAGLHYLSISLLIITLLK